MNAPQPRNPKMFLLEYKAMMCLVCRYSYVTVMPIIDRKRRPCPRCKQVACVDGRGVYSQWESEWKR